MELQADLHNFGKKVEAVERASGTWFQKPRSVYWEWLFFGKDSPLKPIFSEAGENGDQPLSKYLFNLEVEPVHEWLGYSKKVDETSIEQPPSEQFYGFGVLIAYAYIFGIRDLHRYNLVMTATHLQVVDAEVVLTKLVLPHETVLLPFKDVPFELCGLRRLVLSLESLSENQVSALNAGYVDLFDLVLRNASRIKNVFEKLDRNQPVRVILRNTLIYRNILEASQNQNDLLASERLQLQRGDIPYFFKRIGDTNLRRISDSDNSSMSVTNTGRFKDDVVRHALAIDWLIPDEIFLKQKMAQGLFLLQKKLKLNGEHKLKFGSAYLIVSDEKIIFNGIENQTYLVKTSYNAHQA